MNVDIVYTELLHLLSDSFDDFIDAVNERHNDGLKLEHLEITSLEDVGAKSPFAVLTVENPIMNEKNKIVENKTYNFSLKINIPDSTKDKHNLLWRYFEAGEDFLNEHKSNPMWQYAKMTKISNNEVNFCCEM